MAGTDIGKWLQQFGASALEAEVRDTEVSTVADLLIVVQERDDWELFVEDDDDLVERLHTALEKVRNGGDAEENEDIEAPAATKTLAVSGAADDSKPKSSSRTKTLCGRRWNKDWLCCRGQAKWGVRAV